MTALGAIKQQWHKSDYADRLAKHLAQQKSLKRYFSAMVEMNKLADLIAALSFREQDWRFQQEEISDDALFLALFDCFQLLFVKLLQGLEMQQEEYVILVLARHYAEEMQKAELTPELVKQSSALLKAFEQGNQLRVQRQRAARNMC
ncbi:hypothetical protein [Paraferrimonas sedimenticola]|uniref:Uncharacterized protein n=1 Tax=Paraferrimonas sedimenticola TaxID=375674 RepID=A0AA37RYQ5_9GAMM|nr:hypothetical protein [Paraferrimonas sedimenticola]GLP97097.1 hypothetical protein GCM10007895_24030 [Paraferrimonas sedimenticola]